jgi:DNA-binding NarL/FixJ family response regulator
MAIHVARELAPDIVLMDMCMPGMAGLAAAREIKASRPSTVIVLISSTHPDELRLESDRCADAIIWKSELRPGLLGDIWLGRHVRHSPSPF